MIHSVVNFIMVAAMAAAVPSEFPVSDIKDINKGVGIIADNTDNIKVLDVDIDIWNCLFAILAFGVGVFAAVYDWKGYKASKMTADNVVRVSEEVQVAQFNDLIRHFHRNLICSLAMSYKQVDGDRHTTYISESHLYKLKTLPEDIIHTERYNTNNELYSRMHEMKLLLRNYDMEIDVALMHFKNSDIDVEDLIAIDFDNLLFKPYFLISKIVTIEKEVYPGRCFVTDADPLKQAVFVLISTHFNNVRANYDKLLKKDYIPMLNESLKEGIFKSMSRGVGRLTVMMEKPYDISMEEILSDSNPFIDQNTIDFISLARTKLKGTVLETFAGGKYLAALLSEDFDAVAMINYAIAIDLELERNTIKALNIRS